jgi:hypothetical protein
MQQNPIESKKSLERAPALKHQPRLLYASLMLQIVLPFMRFFKQKSEQAKMV